MADRDGVDPVDLFVFAPLGAFLSLQKDLPKWIEAGRQRLDSEIVTARGIGKLAVGQMKRQGGTASPATKKTVAKRAASKKAASKKAASKKAAPPAASASSAAASPPPVSDLPIAEYDLLSAVQILPLLTAMSPEDLTEIEAYESANRQRRTILHRITQIRMRR